ncbi:MAG TPA: hypothetical protein PK297_00620 [Spirochaetota bacterium]|nr:hypothetical protein [Spirochaetota bacterium]
MKNLYRLGLVLTLLVMLSACSSVKADKELETAIKDAAANATLDMRYAFVRGPQEKVISDIILKKGVVASLPTLSLALISEDPKIRVVANRYLYREIKDYISEFEKNPEATPKAAIENLVKGIEMSTNYVTFYAVASTTMLATMYGMEDRLIKAVKAHPEKALMIEMVQNILRYGRLRTFPVVRDWAASGEKYALTHAFSALRNMYRWTEEEKKTIGEWARQYLTVEDPETRVRVIYALYQAGGAYYDSALEKVEREIEGGSVPKLFIDWLKNMAGNETDAQKVRRLSIITNGSKVAADPKK